MRSAEAWCPPLDQSPSLIIGRSRRRSDPARPRPPDDRPGSTANLAHGAGPVSPPPVGPIRALTEKGVPPMSMASPPLRLRISTRAPPRIYCNPHTHEHIGTPPGPRNRGVAFDPPVSRNPDQSWDHWPWRRPLPSLRGRKDRHGDFGRGLRARTTPTLASLRVDRIHLTRLPSDLASHICHQQWITSRHTGTSGE
jgi:hypothetical protein